MTHAEALDSWRVDGELRGGHRPSETIAFVSELQEIADEQQRQRALPAGVILGGGACEPWWLTRLRARFGR